MPWPDPQEVATLIVNGERFTDWETVMVKQSQKNPFMTCRFTCSEDQPVANNWNVMPIKPGDWVTVELGGILAFTGQIGSRQVYYDADRHHVELIAVSKSEILTTASVTHPTMELKKVNLEKLIRTVISPLPVPFKVVGGSLPTAEIPRVNLPLGMTKWEAIDRYSRPFGINFMSDATGALVAIAGPTGGTDTVEEGKNIIVGREIVFNRQMYEGQTVGQPPGSNAEWGPKITQKHASESYTGGEFVKSFLGGMPLPPQVIKSEVTPWSSNILPGRIKTERGWNSNDEITVWITVFGWMRPSGGLWQAKQQVEVISPMLIMNETLEALSVTFTQDNATGTRTVLELVNKEALSTSGGRPGAT